jgi:DNA/RNA endonuclease G (NUC1)
MFSPIVYYMTYIPYFAGKSTRRFATFMPDPAVDEEFTAENSDYWKSGWSRGHMSPAGNNKINPVIGS